MDLVRLYRIAEEVAAKPAPKKNVDLPGDYLSDVSRLQKDLTKLLVELQKAVQSGNKAKHERLMRDYGKLLAEHQQKYPGDNWGYEDFTEFPAGRSPKPGTDAFLEGVRQDYRLFAIAANVALEGSTIPNPRDWAEQMVGSGLPGDTQYSRGRARFEPIIRTSELIGPYSDPP